MAQLRADVTWEDLDALVEGDPLILRDVARGLVRERDRLADFARWLVALDDPGPFSAGRITRQTVTLTQIIERARVALGEKD